MLAVHVLYYHTVSLSKADFNNTRVCWIMHILHIPASKWMANRAVRDARVYTAMKVFSGSSEVNFNKTTIVSVGQDKFLSHRFDKKKTHRLFLKMMQKSQSVDIISKQPQDTVGCRQDCHRLNGERESLRKRYIIWISIGRMLLHHARRKTKNATGSCYNK